ncbi:MAG: bifunctional diaminohydroxyphosphoribosylaminopyrimidine deaminase/5-amino-6-(5-phosphoribosylamino)uracil reductase RibD [Candidatus Sumerlaeia bacterium]|nr:bifunctional diaminohydroxyphosphoribosylaminopyrimidine deaminase/5-amino-6-(5-phosphoribosylamino)uracil reductase RibD [Candidatus Sumerlaeia bacterium]
MNLQDEKWMARAIELAAMGAGKCRPNPAVGSVVVSPGGELLGEGFHHGAGLPHAEVEALKDVASKGKDAKGACLYVNLEPCNHHGRTPPCCDAILNGGIARVVIAQRDPNIKARGGVERLREAGVDVRVGVLTEKALELNAAFNIYHGIKRPLVTLKWAMTLDGCTSMASGDSKWITGELARGEVHRRRAGHDAVLAGVNTVITDQARLTARLPENDPAQPPAGLKRWRIVLDTDLRLPPHSPFMEPSDGCTPLVVCADDSDRAKQAALLETGAEVLPLKRGKFGISLPDLSLSLFDLGIQSIYVEGGRRVAGALLRHGMADRVECWMAGKIAGGSHTPHLGPTASPAPFPMMSDALHLHNVALSHHGPDFLMEGWLTNWQAMATEGTFA